MILSRSTSLFTATLGTLGAFAFAACSSSAPNRSISGTGKTDGATTEVVDEEGEGGTPGGCTPNAGNFDFPGDNCDNDDDGNVDNPPSCDDALDIDGDADEFAKALGLCHSSSSDTEWGVASARYTSGYKATSAPEDFQHGILSKFGAVLTPTEGASLGVLSTGYAREYNDSKGKSAVFKGFNGQLFGAAGDLPAGYPKAAAGCEISTKFNNVAVTSLEIRVPNNAKGFSFDFNFFSSEWPEYVCTEFNDGFLAVLESEAFNGGSPENISFDAQGNPVSVNNGFFDRCTPNTKTCGDGKETLSACSGGEDELKGTGYYNKGSYCDTSSTGGGATGWLTTSAPVKPGETIKLKFMIWNTGDTNYQSSVLLDNFRWEVGETVVGTDRPN